MKRMMRITTAALFGATMLATPALAQTGGALGEDGSAQQKMQTDDQMLEGSVDTGTTAAVESDFDSALEMIGNTDAAAAIGNFPADGEVRIVHIESLDDSYKSRLDQAMAESEAEVQELHAAIDSNAAVKSKLEAESVDTADVVSADAALNGSVIVYVR